MNADDRLRMAKAIGNVPDHPTVFLEGLRGPVRVTPYAVAVARYKIMLAAGDLVADAILVDWLLHRMPLLVDGRAAAEKAAISAKVEKLEVAKAPGGHLHIDTAHRGPPAPLMTPDGTEFGVILGKKDLDVFERGPEKLP